MHIIELTHAQFVFAATLVEAEVIVGFPDLIPRDDEARLVLWEAGRTACLADGLLVQEETSYRFDPQLLFKIAIVAAPRVALVGSAAERVGCYVAQDVAVVMRRTADGGVRLVGVKSPADALSKTCRTEEVTLYRSTTAGVQIMDTEESASCEELVARALKELNGDDEVRSQS